MKRGLARFWYRFKNWFRTKPGPGEPLTFLCGSEEELRRVTMWMCHANEKVFLERTRSTIRFIASTPYDRGHASLNRMEDYTCLPRKPWSNEGNYIMRWSSVVFDFNQFTGTHWANEPCISEGVVPALIGGLPRYGLSQLFGVCEFPLHLKVTVLPPSAHERAEALLSLSEWLDGKVSEEEKRELLGLCD